MNLRLLLFLLLFAPQVFSQTFVEGMVRDSAQKRPLAFVSIAVQGFPEATAMSDIDGLFSIQLPNGYPAQLNFSYIGYRSEQLTLESANGKTKLRVELTPSSQQLRTFEFLAGENPAHRIIRETWKRRDQHDPEKLKSYRCQTYNKLVLSGRPDTAFEAKKIEDELKLKSYDSLFSKQHLFMIESSNERLFRKGKVKENVIGSKVSGLQEASVFMLALQFQPFSFYAPLVELNGQKLLNPISRNSEDVYSFVLEDTLFSGRDSVYVIRFQPRKNSTIEGLKGVLYISAPDYAIQNVVAEPASDNSTLRLRVQQQYKKTETGVWFPEQLNTDMIFLTVKLTGYKMYGESRTYVSKPEINPELSSRLFDEAELDVQKGSSEKSQAFWQTVRIEDLTEQEQQTYYQLDSLFRAENMAPKIKAVEALVRGYIPIKWFDLELNRIMRFNNHEGFRLGAGGITNDKVSRHFGIGGYIAYGFKDQVTKYGAESRIYLYPRRELELRMMYQQDVYESGFQTFVNDRKPLLTEQVRQVLVRNMNGEERSEVSLGWRWLKFLRTDLFIRQAHVKTLFDYQYDSLASNTRYTWLEQGASFTYCYKEKFYRNGKLKISLGGKSPVFRLLLTRGSDLSLGGKTDYLRADFRMEYAYQWRRIGKTVMLLSAGMIDGNVPYARLYNGKGNLSGNADLRAVSTNSFETMHMNEILTDRFASLFFQHHLGSFFHVGTYKPLFILVHNMMVGTLGNTNRSAQKIISFSVPEKGYFESGLLINNLVTLNTGGYGLGAYYRYGTYSDPNWKKNISLKLSLSVLF